jgi:hypothetical protein
MASAEAKRLSCQRRTGPLMHLVLLYVTSLQMLLHVMTVFIVSLSVIFDCDACMQSLLFVCCAAELCDVLFLGRFYFCVPFATVC